MFKHSRFSLFSFLFVTKTAHGTVYCQYIHKPFKRNKRMIVAILQYNRDRVLLPLLTRPFSHRQRLFIYHHRFNYLRYIHILCIHIHTRAYKKQIPQTQTVNK